MRLAFILPAETTHQGGVQRFAAVLYEAMSQICDLETFRFHPGPGENRVTAGVRTAIRLAVRHEVEPFDGVFSTWHGPRRILPQVPMVGFIHDLRAVPMDRPNVSLSIRRSIVDSWSAVCVPSEHVADQVRSLAPDSVIAVVGEGLDHLSSFEDRRRRWEARDELVVIAGRAPHKRAALGVAAAQMAAERLDCKITILGEAPGTELTSRARVLSAYSDAQLADVMGRARVVVAPTSFEGFGLAVGEAMFFGAPIVHGEDSHLGPLVAHGGIEVRPDDASFRDAVLRAWGDPSLASGAQSVSRRYTWRGTAERITQVISS